MRTTGGGILVAIGALAGALIGVRAGEPSAGLLIGLGAGALAALVWARLDAFRRRRGADRMNGGL